MTINSLLNQLQPMRQKLAVGSLNQDEETTFYEIAQYIINHVGKKEEKWELLRLKGRVTLMEVTALTQILLQNLTVDTVDQDTWQNLPQTSSPKKHCAKKANFSCDSKVKKALFNEPPQPLGEIDHEIAIMTADILNSQGFVKDPRRDLNRVLSKYQTISETQGCIEFCAKTIQYAIKTPSVLSPAYLRNQEHVNIHLCLTLKYKRIGHAFNLERFIPLNGGGIHFEGFNETFVHPMLKDMFDRFVKTRMDLVTQEMYDFIEQAQSKAIWHENISDEKTIEAICKQIHDPSNTKAVCVGSGYDWHSTQILFFSNEEGDFMFYCNRGAGCKGKPGIHIFKINKSKITPEFLRRVASRLSYTYDTYTSLEKIVEELAATSIAYISMKGQKVGNCVYASEKAKYRALILLAIAKNAPKKNNASSKRQWLSFLVPQVLEQAKKIYKAFSIFDKEAVLKDFLIDLRENRVALSVYEVAMPVQCWITNHWEKNKIDQDLLVEAKTLITNLCELVENY